MKTVLDIDFMWICKYASMPYHLYVKLAELANVCRHLQVLLDM